MKRLHCAAYVCFVLYACETIILPQQELPSPILSVARVDRPTGVHLALLFRFLRAAALAFASN